jgi:hypothetical protein
MMRLSATSSIPPSLLEMTIDWCIDGSLFLEALFSADPAALPGEHPVGLAISQYLSLKGKGKLNNYHISSET